MPVTKPIYPECSCTQGPCPSCLIWNSEERLQPEIASAWAPPAKKTNPKDVHAEEAGKIPLDLLEPAADEQIAQVLASGADKYGRRNFADPQTPIHARTYIAAARRHLAAILDGEELDPDSGFSHWAHVGATVHVVLAAMDAGTFVDDR